MKLGAAAAAFVVLCLSAAASTFAKGEHVLVLVGETAFEKAVKVISSAACKRLLHKYYLDISMNISRRDAIPHRYFSHRTIACSFEKSA